MTTHADLRHPRMHAIRFPRPASFLAACLGLAALCLGVRAQDLPPLNVESVDANAVRLTWTDAADRFLVQESIAPASGGIWWAIDQAPTANGDLREIVRGLDPAMLRCFFRLQPRGPLSGLDYLRARQDPTGFWNPGTSEAGPDTAAALLALRMFGLGGQELSRGLAALGSQAARNHDDLARRTVVRAAFAQDTASDVAELFNGQGSRISNPFSPAYPGHGWGLAAGFGNSPLDTALVRGALAAAAVPGGLAVGSDAVPASGSAGPHPFVVAAGASDVVLRVHHVAGATLRFKLTPPSSGTLTVDLAPRTTPIDIQPLPDTAGTWTLVVDNLGAAPAAYSAEVGYTTAEGLDTFRLSAPLIYLARAQNPDGGWGLSAGMDSHLLVTAEVLRNLAAMGTEFVGTETLATGAAWLAARQNPDGGFSSSPDASNVAETALALRALAAMEATTGLASASQFLRTAQGYDGSWSRSVSLTAAVVGALHLPPKTAALPDQSVTAPDPFVAVNLDDFVADPDHADADLTWAVTGNSQLQVSLVNRVATVTYPDGATPSETLTFTATDPDGLTGSVSATFSVNTVAPVDYIIARGGSATGSGIIGGDAAVLAQTASIAYAPIGIPSDVSYLITSAFGLSATEIQIDFELSAGLAAPLGDHEFQVQHELRDSNGSPLGPLTGSLFNFRIRVTP